MDETKGKTLLAHIDAPSQIKTLSAPQLQQLAEEVRDVIIRTVAKTGGHLAPSLGVVELTIALHYVFDSPRDKIVWDVGHQAYAHKILTGRRDQFGTLRQYGGVSGFPKRSESVYDSYGTGHSSTSISAALGISVGQCLGGSNARSIAVIGDGSMTGGLAFEALNQAGDQDKNLIVILNDNEMSISPNVGALSSFLSRKLSSKTLTTLKREMENFLKSIPGIGPNIIQVLKRSENSLVSLLTPGMLFQALDFHYIGPIQGNRLDRLIPTLQAAKEIHGPVLVHIMTQKGRGYYPAECDPTTFHGVGCFDVATGKTISAPAGTKKVPSFTDVFGSAVIRMAEENRKIIAITAAMPQGTGLDRFAQRFPERFFDVGIAEQHAVTFAAGLATEGFKPVVAVYSTFLQRAYDQVVHDVCLQDLPVVFALDRAGIVGEDGPTHHGVFDLSFLRHIPNLTVMAPKDENELQHMLKTALSMSGPAAVRYPRGAGVGVPLDRDLALIPVGKAEVLKEGTDVLLLAVGPMVYAALEAAGRLEKDGIHAAVVNARFIKPLDSDTILEWAEKTGKVVTIEENALQGGFGSAVLELFQESSFFPEAMVRMGIPDGFVAHGGQTLLRRLYNLDADGVEAAVRDLMNGHNGKILHAIGQAAG